MPPCIKVLAQLKGLTHLDLSDCYVQDSTLAQLSGLSKLHQLTMPMVRNEQDETVHLTAVQSLTTLTKLDMTDDPIACKGILELPALKWLRAAGIILDPETKPTASMCSGLTSLTLS
jgi:hypothetical protein